ncbi:MAG: GTP-binding protein, partial [Deltaproteobacteria bacterium]|nr:GTP-binding protein [Deltaproteobacteria bacterium]
MKVYETKNIRNVGLYGHQSSGKTSLGEAFLFLGKTSTRLCSVNEGNSNFDFDAEEFKRRLSISTSIGYAEWKKNLVNIVDTPGDTNFLVDTMISAMAIDAGIVVISASDSIQVGTEKTWGYLNDENLPRLIFINKMDRERADFDKVAADIVEIFGNSAIPFQIPMGK